MSKEQLINEIETHELDGSAVWLLIQDIGLYNLPKSILEKIYENLEELCHNSMETGL